jgi:hypothetical protein
MSWQYWHGNLLANETGMAASPRGNCTQVGVSLPNVNARLVGPEPNTA